MPAKPPARVKQRAVSAGGETGRPLLPILIGASGFVMLALVLGWMLLGGTGRGASGGIDAEEATGARVALEQAECTLTVVAAQEYEPAHTDVPTPETEVDWNTFPPTTGPHYQVPAVFGAYDEPLPQARVVHNLEHGGIYIQYGRDVSAETVAELKAFYDDHLNGTLLAPLPQLGRTIALGAWVAPDSSTGTSDRGKGYLAKCTRFDEPAYAAFFDAFQFKGPERFPESALKPGS